MEFTNWLVYQWALRDIPLTSLSGQFSGMFIALCLKLHDQHTCCFLYLNFQGADMLIMAERTRSFRLLNLISFMVFLLLKSNCHRFQEGCHICLPPWDTLWWNSFVDNTDFPRLTLQMRRSPNILSFWSMRFDFGIIPYRRHFCPFNRINTMNLLRFFGWVTVMSLYRCPSLP